MSILSFSIDQIIRSRRSVYPEQFNAGKMVEDHLILQILENACYAPTHKKTEPWRFTIFAGEGRRRFADMQGDSYRKSSGAKFNEDKYQKLISNPLRCSHIVSIGMKRSVGNALPEWEEIAAVACAVQNLALTVAAYGLGGYWSSGGMTTDPAVKPFFGLEDQDRLMGFYFIGQVAIPSASSSRKPLGALTQWIRE